MNNTGAKAHSPRFPKVRLELEFFATLKERVYADLGSQSLKGNAATFAKAVFFIISYMVLLGTALSVHMSPFFMFLDAIGLGLLAPCIGFCVMHDAIHGTLSSNPAVNRWFGYSLDLLGCSSFFWYVKHNIIHHTYPNVHTYDDDIDIMLMRTHEDQPWKPIYRHQYKYWYWIPLYSLTYFAWVYLMDFTKLKNRKIGKSPRKPLEPNIREFAILIAGKFWHVSALFIAPCFVQGWLWAACYVTLMLITGFTIAIVFQLAHLVDTVSLISLPADPHDFENANKVHQLLTTADSDVDNKVVIFFFGGLNFQVEHHLFPEIHSRHYPQMQKVVEATCQEYGFPYHCFKTTRDGIRSHVAFLKILGTKPSYA